MTRSVASSTTRRATTSCSSQTRRGDRLSRAAEDECGRGDRSSGNEITQALTLTNRQNRDEPERLDALGPALESYNRSVLTARLGGLTPLQRVNNLPETYN